MAHDPHEQFGRYELQFLIGRGGMAETWRARLLGAAGVTKPVLIKKVLPEFADDDAFVSMFISEARISASLSHGNVAQVFDFGMMDGQYFLAMELVDGQPLNRVLKRGARMGLPRLPIPLAVYVALEMCRGLNYAHTRTNERGVPLGIVHRDISPDNVLISYEGQVKIVDFGIAKARMLRGFHTEPGVVRGKYLYFSPEQARGRDVDARTDIWATGLVLYEMLCGQPPVVGPEPVVLTRMAQGDFPPPIQLRQELPPELNELILKALSVDVARRFESANAFGDTLAAFLYSFAPRFSTMNLAYLVRELFREDLQKDGRELQVPPAFVEELSTWREQESPGSGPRAPLPDVTPEDARPTTPGVGAGVRPAPSGPPLASTRPTTPGPAKAVRGDGGAGERSTGGGASPATPPRASTSGSATRSTPPRSAVTSGPRAMPGGAVSSVEASNGGAPSPTTPGPSSPRRTQTSGELPASSASTSEARSFSASPARRTRTEGSLPAAPELTVPAFAFSASAPSGPSVSPPPRRTRTEGSLAAVVPEAPDSTVPEFSLSASNPSGPSSSPPRRARTEGSLPSVVPEASEFTRPEFSLSALIASGPSSTTPPRRTQTSTLFSVASDDAAENTMPAFSVSASSSSGGSVSSPRRTQTAGSLPAAVHDASSAVSTPTVRFPSVQGPSSSSPHRTQTSGSMPSDLQEVSSARAANSHPEGYPGSAQTTSGAAPPLPRRTQTSGPMPMVLQEVPSARAATSHPEGYPGSAPSTSAAASPPPRRTQTSGPVPLVAQDASTRAASSPAEGHSAPAPGTVATSTSSPRRTRTLGSIPAVVPESSARAASASVESPHPGATSATPGAPRRTHTLDSAPRAIPEASTRAASAPTELLHSDSVTSLPPRRTHPLGPAPMGVPAAATRAASAPTEVLRSDAVPTPPFPASPPPRRTLPAGMAPMSNQEASARAANAPTVVLNSVPAGSAPTVRLASISIPRRHRRTLIAAGAALLLLSAVAIPFLVSRRSEPGEISPTQPIPAPTEPGGANPLRPQARPQPAPGDPTAASPDPRPLVAVSPHGSPGADGTEPTDEPESVGEYPKETAFVLDSKRHVLRVPLDLVAFSRLDASASYSFWGMTQAKWMADPLIQEPTPRREPLVFFLLSGDAVRPEVREGIVSRHPITLQGVRAISLFTLGEPTREDLSPQSVYLRKVNTEDQQRFTFHPEPMRLSARKGFLIKGLDVRQTYALSLVPRGEGVFLRGRAHGPAAQVACLEWSPQESAPGPREPGAHAEQPLQVLISEWREARVRGIQGLRCAFIDDASFDNEGEAEVHVTPWEKARRPSTPNHEEAERLALQAQRLARSGQHHDAFLLAEDCLRMAPEQPDCLVLSGAMQLLLGRTEGALERYRTFVKRHPHHPEARSVNGILQTYGQTNSGKTPPPLGR